MSSTGVARARKCGATLRRGVSATPHRRFYCHPHPPSADVLLGRDGAPVGYIQAQTGTTIVIGEAHEVRGPSPVTRAVRTRAELRRCNPLGAQAALAAVSAPPMRHRSHSMQHGRKLISQ